MDINSATPTIELFKINPTNKLLQNVNSLKNVRGQQHIPIIPNPESPFPYFIHNPGTPFSQVFRLADKAPNNLHTTHVDKTKGFPLFKEQQYRGTLWGLTNSLSFAPPIQETEPTGPRQSQITPPEKLLQFAPQHQNSAFTEESPRNPLSRTRIPVNQTTQNGAGTSR
jgi:hypothetical protein